MASFDEAIPPGQAGKINATVHTANYRGQVLKTIAVTTNDPALASAVLTLKAKIVGSVELLPNPAFSVTVAGPESRPGRILVRKDASETGPLEVANLAVSLPWIKATLRKIETAEPAIEGLPEAKAGDVLIELRPEGPPPKTGSFQGSVVFDTGLVREPKVTVPLYAFVRAAISVSPQEAIVHPGAESIVLVAIRADVDLEKVTATAQPAAFRTSLERANARTIRMKVTVDETAGPAPASGSITIQAGSATATVPVRVQR